METYEGGCHCGAVRFRVRTDLSLISECNRSLCAKKGILHLPVEAVDFELLRGAEALTTYQFNTNTAKHPFCRHCGIHSFNVPRLHPDRYSVNARCLDGVELTGLQPRTFDGRNWEMATAPSAVFDGVASPAQTPSPFPLPLRWGEGCAELARRAEPYAELGEGA